MVNFFRVIMPSILSENKLPMPIKFVRIYGGEISNFIRINVPVSGIWCVGIERAGNQMLWLSDGWQKFMEHHRIRYGYFLIFKYTGNSEFDVKIFDLTTTEIDYPPISTHNSERPARVNEEFGVGNDESVDILNSPVVSPMLSSIKCNTVNESQNQQAHGGLPTVSPTNKDRDALREYAQIAGGLKLSSSDDHSHGKAGLSGKKLLSEDKMKARSSSCRTSNYLKGRRATADEKKRAFCAARMFKPDNPSFVVTLEKYNLSKSSILNMPAKFVGHLGQDSEEVYLQDSDGRKWCVHCVRRYDRITCLSKGWPEFVQGNKLDEGDVCVLELIQTGKSILKVSVFRAKEEVHDQ